MKVNPNMFRGYDLRGIAGKDITPEIAEHLGKAFGTYLMRRNIHKAIVGHDARETSEDYTAAIIRGLNWAGVSTTNIGMVLVGMFYWTQYHLDVEGGVFVTASHNPAEYNGFKFANGFSETLVSEGIQEIRKMVENEDYDIADTPGSTQTKDIKPAYYNDIIKRVPLKKKLKVVVEASNATAGPIVPQFLRQAGMEVIESNTNVDPTFPLGTPDPTEVAVANRLSKKVLEHNADIGFSYDTDGDRIGVVDEKGGVIWNDVIVAILATDVLNEHPGSKIMFNALCSQTVPETIKREGGDPFMWRTGHSFLKKKNQEEKAAFIGELSGHFFFSKDFYNHDDGMYATLRVLRYLENANVNLSDAVAKLPQFISSPEIKVGCSDDQKVALMDKIAEKLRTDYPDAIVIDDERVGDGVRLEFNGSMFIVRYSQNGPYITVKFESKNEADYDELKKYINDLLHSYDEIDWSYGVNVESLD